jgi:hypothetical protein
VRGDRLRAIRVTPVRILLFAAIALLVLFAVGFYLFGSGEST